MALAESGLQKLKLCVCVSFLLFAENNFLKIDNSEQTLTP